MNFVYILKRAIYSSFFDYVNNKNLTSVIKKFDKCNKKVYTTNVIVKNITFSHLKRNDDLYF